MLPLSVIAFLSLAGLTLGSAGIVAFSKNIIHSALALLGTFMGIAGLYITLSADFLAATQILVYVGGTLTLILFAVMLTSRIEDMKESNPRAGLGIAFGLVSVVLLVLGKVATQTNWPSEVKGAMPSTATSSKGTWLESNSDTLPSCTFFPATSTASRSHSVSASLMMCVQKSTVVPLLRCSKMMSRIKRRPSGSNPDVGSSRINSRGLLISACAKAMRCTMPLE